MEAVPDQVVLLPVQVLDRRFQVADSPVDQLGAAAAGPFGEIVLLDQGGPQSAAGRIERDPASGGAAADHQQVERFPLF